MARKPKAPPVMVNRKALKGSDNIFILSYKDSRGRFSFGYEVDGTVVDHGYRHRSMAKSLAEWCRDKGSALHI